MNPLPPHIERILNLARWAPSGDNTQPWRFEVVSESLIRIHAHDTREHCVYDLDGHASQIAHGALLETLVIAASGEGFRTEIRRLPESPEVAPIYQVALAADQAMTPDPLLASIERRVVQRRALSTRPLAPADKAAIMQSIPGFQLVWFEGWPARWRLARFMFANAKNRLTMPEAYPTHRDVIEWNARFSDDRIPDQAVGVDPMTTRLMRWVMKSWRRVSFFNTWLAGTYPPRLQLDLLPGLRCAAHFALLADKAPVGIDDYVAGGRALQRLWLTATQRGLYLQPEMTPVIFSRYVREGRAFTQTDSVRTRASRLAVRMARWLEPDGANRTLFMARLGYGREPVSRSLRKSVSQLLAR